MKKILYVLMITSLLLLSACSSNAASSNPESTESETTLSNSEVESLSPETQALSETESALPDDQADDPTFLGNSSNDSASVPTDPLDDLNRQAEELADSSEKITEGDLYDSITAIYPDVVIHTNANNDLSIRINLNHDTIETDSLAFFETIISICTSCALENNFSNISFTMMVDSELVTMITFLDYASFSSFSTAEPIVMVDEYETTIKYIYSTLFSKSDITNQYLDSLGK